MSRESAPSSVRVAFSTKKSLSLKGTFTRFKLVNMHVYVYKKTYIKNMYVSIHECIHTCRSGVFFCGASSSYYDCVLQNDV